MTQDNRDKFIYLAGQYGQLVKFYNVEELCADRLAEIRKCFPIADKTSFTIATFYRILIPFVFPSDVGKAIYLDSDLVVTLDINELWQIDIGNKSLGVVWSSQISLWGVVKEENYFNAGVLLMNLEALRGEEETVRSGMKFFAENPQHVKWLDQDLLNYSFEGKTAKLPLKFNWQVHYWARPAKEIPGKKIYHYVGVKFRINSKDLFDRLWMDYYVKTPWFDTDAIYRLYEGFQKLHVDFKQSMVNLSAAMSGKTRGFFILPNDVGWLKNFFSIRDDEEIILAENQESLNKLLDAMNASRGKKVFFIMLPKFPFQILTQAGFAEDKDFMNGLDFFSEAQNFPMSPWPLIQAM